MTPMSTPPPPPPDPGARPAVDGGSRLAELADLLYATDRLYAQVVAAIAAVQTDGACEVDAGLTLDLWLGQIGRMTAPVRARLLTAVDVLARMPATSTALADGRLSWSQVSAIVTEARRLPVDRRGELDGHIAAALPALASAEPDELTWRVSELVDRWQPSDRENAERRADGDEWLIRQPDLLGGGTLHAGYGPANWALLNEALDDAAALPTETEVDAAVADEADDEIFDDRPLARRRRAAARERSRRRSGVLIDWASHHLAGHRTVDHTASDPAATGCARTADAKPAFLLVADAHALLDDDTTPAWLLTTLTGGTLNVSSAYARRLLDQRGGDLRGITLDQCGQIVGVGRKTSRPPGWLTDAILARDLTDTAPGSTTPARHADLDHIVPWPTGTTDVDNLTPTGRRMHRAKTHGHWHVTGTAGTTLTWTHTHTGLRIHRPPTRRQLDDPWPDPGPPRPPPADEPPPRLAEGPEPPGDPPEP